MAISLRLESGDRETFEGECLGLSRSALTVPDIALTIVPLLLGSSEPWPSRQ